MLGKRKLPSLFVVGIVLLLVFSLIVLHSIAPMLFPSYYWYILVAVVIFIVLINFDFGVLSLFSWHFYFGSLLFLLLPLVIGQLTRGTIRWINLGALTIQPSEIVRPFLFVFFANYLTREKLTTKRLFKSILLLALPVILILVQPSLGVSILTVVGFVGAFLATGASKKILIFVLLVLVLALPFVFFALAPYQKQRVQTFFNPSFDPFGSGYNSLQSQIAVGSGKFLGRGLGKGVQTQLAFLPERHTDFIFASISEEMGMLGSLVVMFLIFFMLFNLAVFTQKAISVAARSFLSGFFLVIFAQTIIHLGMNMGLLPITGVPLPLVSAGGSSLLGTTIGLAFTIGAIKTS